MHSKQAGLKDFLLGMLVSYIAKGLYETVEFKVKTFIIKHTNSPRILGYIALHDSNPKLRILAIDKLVDQKLMRKLLKVEKHKLVRKVILKKLAPPALEAEYIAAEDRKARLAIIDVMQAQPTLAHILKAEVDPLTARAITLKISDPDLIEKFTNHPLKEIRDWAGKKLEPAREREQELVNNPNLLLKVILESKALDNHLSRLLRWVTIADILLSIVKAHPNSEVRKIAIDNLQGNTTLLNRIARGNYPPEDRLAAMDLLPVANLIPLVKDGNPRIRMKVLSRVDPTSHADLIAQAARTDNSAAILEQVAAVTKSKIDLDNVRKRIDSKRFPHIIKLIERRETEVA